MSAPFSSFSSHKFLHLFTFVHPFFLLTFVPSFFYRPFPLSHLCVHLLHRPQLYSSARFIRVSPCLFQFSSQSSRDVRLPTTHIPPYSPRIVVIMLILSTLGWCPLNVISSKISVSLSTNSQSTGSLTSNSHVPVFALLSPLITVAVTE